MLITHVLQSMPLHLVSALNPPKGVINKLHRIFNIFSWGNSTECRKRHWVKWEDFCLPKDEGGIGFRSLYDMSNALFSKLWWQFSSKPPMWSSYMVNKYCKKWHPVIATAARGASTTWKKMVIVREIVEHQILWRVKRGDSIFGMRNGHP